VVLGAVLAHVGGDLAAHTQLQRELDAAVSIPAIAAEYLTIAQAAQADRWAALLAASGLASDQVAAVRGSDAYGPLVAAFRDAEARGLDITATFPRLVRSRELGTAEDVAAVLHDRVTYWAATASTDRRPVASRFVVGLIPEALRVTDPDMKRALTERAQAMERRARALAEQAVAGNAAWTRQLGPPPRDPAAREAWLREICTVAAFRDRWTITGRDPAPAEQASVERLGHQKRALEALARAQRIAHPTTGDHLSGRSKIEAVRPAAPSL
jgi:hypothetical protein